MYRKAGLAWYWLAEPQERTLEVVEQQGEKWRYQGFFSDGDAGS